MFETWATGEQWFGAIVELLASTQSVKYFRWGSQIHKSTITYQEYSVLARRQGLQETGNYVYRLAKILCIFAQHVAAKKNFIENCSQFKWRVPTHRINVLDNFYNINLVT